VHRFRVAGEELALSKDRSALRRLATHQSDLIRGVVAFALAASEVAQLSTQLDHIRPLAEDSHFQVREWAWLAVRDTIIRDGNTR
jgi:hypothetical protein